MAFLRCAAALALLAGASAAKLQRRAGAHKHAHARAAAPQVPEQVRLTFTADADATTMGIYWATSNKTADDYVATVQYGLTPDALTMTVTGSNDNYTTPTGIKIASPSLHFAVMTGLKPATFYSYRVGCPAYGFSIVYNFTSRPVTGAAPYPITWLAYGDMGISNSQNTADFTAALIASGEAQFITHAGDISYADNRAGLYNGSIYDGVLNQFYNEVMPSSAYAPYMTSSGNHEAIFGFLAYQKRNSPTLPKNGSPFWHSYNYGPIHFLAFDIDQTWTAGSAQYNFIVQDLAAVDRAVTPWVVAYNHFPLLCSNLFWCPDAPNFQKLYEPIFNAKATKVDLFYAGHVHAAEVQFPQVGGVVAQHSFVDVEQTLQVMVGFPGDIEVCCNDWIKPKPDYSFWREDDVAGDGGLFGFSEFRLENNTHLRLRMYDSGNRTVVLEQWMSRAV